MVAAPVESVHWASVAEVEYALMVAVAAAADIMAAAAAAAITTNVAMTVVVAVADPAMQTHQVHLELLIHKDIRPVMVRS